MMRKSEKAVLIIGTINVLLLFIASAMAPHGDKTDAGSLMLIFVHFIIIIGAFPVLYRAIISSYSVSKNFTLVFTAIAITSAFFLILGSNVTTIDSDDLIFFGLGIIELLPIIWLYIKKRDVIWQKPKKLPFDMI